MSNVVMGKGSTRGEVSPAWVGAPFRLLGHMVDDRLSTGLKFLHRPPIMLQHNQYMLQIYCLSSFQYQIVVPSTGIQRVWLGALLMMSFAVSSNTDMTRPIPPNFFESREQNSLKACVHLGRYERGCTYSSSIRAINLLISIMRLLLGFNLERSLDSVLLPDSVSGPHFRW